MIFFFFPISASCLSFSCCASSCQPLSTAWYWRAALRSLTKLSNFFFFQIQQARLPQYLFKGCVVVHYFYIITIINLMILLTQKPRFAALLFIKCSTFLWWWDFMAEWMVTVLSPLWLSICRRWWLLKNRWSLPSSEIHSFPGRRVALRLICVLVWDFHATPQIFSFQSRNKEKGSVNSEFHIGHR